MAGMILFWGILASTHQVSGFSNYFFSFCMALLPFFGGIYAMARAHKWVSPKGFVSRGVFFLGLGLVFWGCGELIWSYYNFFAAVSAPYPSLADLGFAPSEIFYCIGSIYLARAAGADLGLRRRFVWLFITGISAVMFCVSYYIFVKLAHHGVLVTQGDTLLKSIFDVAYPIGDFVSLTTAVVLSGLSFKFITREYQAAVLAVLAGLAVIFIADSIFSYTTSVGTYFNGDFGDLVFTLSLFFLTFGVLGFAE
jgi:hypothetical protein